MPLTTSSEVATADADTVAAVTAFLAATEHLVDFTIPATDLATAAANTATLTKIAAIYGPGGPLHPFVQGLQALLDALAAMLEALLPRDPPVATALVWLDAAPTLTAIGATATLRAQINDQYGVALADQSGITLTSDDTGVATISGTTVTAVDNGTADITAAYTGVTSIMRTVAVAQRTTTITISPTSPTVPNGTGETFTAAGEDANGFATTLGAGTWASSDPTDFPITSGGVATPNVDSGEAVIQFTETASGVSGTTTITAEPASTGAYGLLLLLNGRAA